MEKFPVRVHNLHPYGWGRGGGRLAPSSSNLNPVWPFGCYRVKNIGCGIFLRKLTGWILIWKNVKYCKYTMLMLGIQWVLFFLDKNAYLEEVTCTDRPLLVEEPLGSLPTIADLRFWDIRNTSTSGIHQMWLTTIKRDLGPYLSKYEKISNCRRLGLQTFYKLQEV